MPACAGGDKQGWRGRNRPGPPHRPAERPVGLGQVWLNPFVIYHRQAAIKPPSIPSPPPILVSSLHLDLSTSSSSPPFLLISWALFSLDLFSLKLFFRPYRLWPPEPQQAPVPGPGSLSSSLYCWVGFPPVIGPTIVCVKSTDMLFSFALSRRVRSRKGWDFVIFGVLNSGR